jgi:hypothetical protein
VPAALQCYVKWTFTPNADMTDDPSGFGLAFESAPVGTPAATSLLLAQAVAFINNWSSTTGATAPISGYLSGCLSRAPGAARVDIYDIAGKLDGKLLGSPIDTQSFTLGPPAPSAAPGLPGGVAACLSYRGGYGTDVEFAPHARPRSSDRGRIYLGPLNTTAITDEPVTKRTILSSDFVANVIGNFIGALTTGLFLDPASPAGQTNQSWGVQQWSRKLLRLKDVFSVWMDDRPDYQRRRSDSPGKIVMLTSPVEDINGP